MGKKGSERDGASRRTTARMLRLVACMPAQLAPLQAAAAGWSVRMAAASMRCRQRRRCPTRYECTACFAPACTWLLHIGMPLAQPACVLNKSTPKALQMNITGGWRDDDERQDAAALCAPAITALADDRITHPAQRFASRLHTTDGPAAACWACTTRNLPGAAGPPAAAAAFRASG